MIGRITAALAVVIAIGTCAIPAGHCAQAAPARLLGNHPKDAETAHPLGNADANQPLTMQIRFALRNRAVLERLLQEQQDPASRNYRKWLKTGEFAQRFGPLPAQINSVAQWLRGEGFSVTAANGAYVEFTGTVADAERAFSVRIFRYGAGAVYANVTDPMVPPRFAGVIGSILGLDNMMAAVPASAKRQPPPIIAWPAPATGKAVALSSGDGGGASSPDYDFGGLAFGPQDVPHVLR